MTPSPAKDDFQRYYYLGGGWTWLLPDSDPEPGIDVNKGTDFAAHLGLRPIEHVAVELRYDDVGIPTHDPDPQSTVNVLNYEGWVGTLNARVYPLGDLDRIYSPYASIGFGYASLDGPTPGQPDLQVGLEEFAARVGVGMEVYPCGPRRSEMGVFLDGGYIVPGGDLDHLRLFSITLGLNVKF